LRIIDSGSAFTRLREQIKICRTETEAALALINSTNLALFKREQISELFAFKGEILATTNKEESYVFFSSSQMVSFNNFRGWIKWAEFCENTNSNVHETQWIESALVCYLAALQVNSSKSKHLIARILWLVSHKKSINNHKKCVEIFGSYWEKIPVWVWIFWIPT
ncbi:hypothetical protein MHBO_004922, partial [Bonamia ostreae]